MRLILTALLIVGAVFGSLIYQELSRALFLIVSLPTFAVLFIKRPSRFLKSRVFWYSFCFAYYAYELNHSPFSFAVFLLALALFAIGYQFTSSNTIIVLPKRPPSALPLHLPVKP